MTMGDAKNRETGHRGKSKDKKVWRRQLGVPAEEVRDKGGLRSEVFYSGCWIQRLSIAWEVVRNIKLWSPMQTR